jgi:hypothetical protein
MRVVLVGAQEAELIEIGLAAALPRWLVVRVAAIPPDRAPGPDAPAVADGERKTLQW